MQLAITKMKRKKAHIWAFSEFLEEDTYPFHSEKKRIVFVNSF